MSFPFRIGAVWGRLNGIIDFFIRHNNWGIMEKESVEEEGPGNCGNTKGRSPLGADHIN